jgi:signal transduction histidine kinase
MEIFVKNTAPIFIDENRLLSSLVNIIKNGIESIDIKGNISVLAEIKNNFGIIKISNNGKVIPQNKQQTIFECGYTDKKNGCGLGLHICKQYLESQNCEIRLIRSTKNETTFEIKIPVYKD